MRLDSKVPGKNHIRGDQLRWIGKEVGVGRFSGINSLDVIKRQKEKEKAKRKERKEKAKRKRKERKGNGEKKETPTGGAKTSRVPAVNAS